ncbi:hypothetical protein WDW89_09405 [Deltaproteobacteria bacterium TL4]
MSLSDTLLSPKNKDPLIQDCVHLIEEEVALKTGFAGVAVKTAFKLMKKFKEDLLQHVFTDLLPKFVEVMEPFHEAYLKSGSPSFQAYLNEKANELTPALLSIMDQRVDSAKSQMLRSGYHKIRGTAEKHVAVAIPKVAKLIDSYLS